MEKSTLKPINFHAVLPTPFQPEITDLFQKLLSSEVKLMTGDLLRHKSGKVDIFNVRNCILSPLIDR